MSISLISTIISLLCISCAKDNLRPEAVQYRYIEEVVIDGIRRTYGIKLPKNYYYNDSARALII
ncbi:hypothetical protein [Parafilimonas sp.]|uniref:hypothetical protein n=1 Tax=Parafilimonas sp. TaxID=1969739 RepID=UPI003F805538